MPAGAVGDIPQRVVAIDRIERAEHGAGGGADQCNEARKTAPTNGDSNFRISRYRIGMMLKTYLAVMAGGALGTGLRLALAGWLTAKYGEAFPVGTLVVNVTGCFVIGAFAALTAPEGFLPAPLLVRQVVMIGVLGGYTTFSAFGLQTLDLLHAGAGLRAGLNAALSLVLCLAAVWLGHRLATVLPAR